jgi:HEAT repeat protein
MTPAAAERLARRIHRYELASSASPGESFVDRLARVAALVAELGGGPRELMAAWLHGVARTGMAPWDLAVRGVSPAVIRIIEAVNPLPGGEPAGQQAIRVRACPGARLVLHAIILERHRLGGPDVWPHAAERDVSLLTTLGLPVPARVYAAAERKPKQASPAPRRGPIPGELRPDHPERFDLANQLASTGTPAALRALLDAYVTADAGNSEWNHGPDGRHPQIPLSIALRQVVTRRESLDDPEWASLLVAMTRHSNYVVRQAGFRGLSAVPHQKVTEQALSDDNPAVVADALRVLPPDRVGAVSRQLTVIGQQTAPQWRLARFMALRMLAEATDPQGRDAVLARLAETGPRDWDGVHRLIAANDPAIVPVLASHLRDGAPGRAAAAFILGEMRAREAVPDLAAALTEALGEAGGHFTAENCIVALGKIGGSDPAALSALHMASQDCRGYAGLWTVALPALAHFDDPQVTDIALEAADDLNPAVREQAIRLLAARGDARAVPRLLVACDGPLAAVALRGLIRLADERAVPTLVRVLATADDRQVLHLAGRAIVASARKPPQFPLWAGSPRPQLRASIWVRGELGTPLRQHDRLADHLTHADELVRARTAAALGKLGALAAAGKLAAALADISPRVRASAATALARVILAADNPPVDPALPATAAVPVAAAADPVAAAVPTTAVPATAAVPVAAAADPATAADPGSPTRERARSWLEPLREDLHPSVRMAAIAALRRLGG